MGEWSVSGHEFSEWSVSGQRVGGACVQTCSWSKPNITQNVTKKAVRSVVGWLVCLVAMLDGTAVFDLQQWESGEGGFSQKFVPTGFSWAAKR